MSIKAVVFDFGNVLSEAPDPATSADLDAIAGTSGGALYRAAMAIRDDWDRGDITAVEYYRRSLSRAGATEAGEGTLKALIERDMQSWARLNPDTLALAAELRRAGLVLGILSNMPHEFLSMARSRFPIFSEVDAAVFSCEARINKPDAGIYRILLERVALPADEILFFDDLAPNVAAAEAAGLRAVLWTGAAAARSRLAELSVL